MLWRVVLVRSIAVLLTAIFFYFVLSLLLNPPSAITGKIQFLYGLF